MGKFNKNGSKEVPELNTSSLPAPLTASGTYDETSLSVITTPAACVEACRGIPSSARAVSINLAMFASLS